MVRKTKHHKNSNTVKPHRQENKVKI